MKLPKKKKITLNEKQRILTAIENFLTKEKTISFGYLYGSFLEGVEFNDIDIAVYFDEKQFQGKGKIFDYGLKLCSPIEDAIRNKDGHTYEIETHPLNLAPLSFRFAVINEGRLLVSNNDDKRVEFEVITRDLYFDFLPHFEYYYKVAILGDTG